jgi:uncharacterized protein (TIGR02996 family)
VEVDFDAALKGPLERELARVQAARRTRLLSLDEVRATAMEAASSTNGFAWRHGGQTGDPRAQTSLCLCVARPDGVAIGLASVRAQEPDPSRAWRGITAWDRYDDAVNAPRVLAWAAKVALVARWKPAPRDDESALREAIRRSPDDDAPRLVYADWLSERGDPRGELIALQCASRPTDELLATHGGAWSQGLKVVFERGFASAVHVSSSAELAQLAGFAPREFVTRVVVERTLNLHALAAAPWLTSVRQLAFHQGPTAQRLDLQGLCAVLASRNLGALETLEVRGQRLGDEGLAQLAEQAGTRLPRVKRLVVEDDQVTARGVAALVATRWFSQLTALSLSGNPLGAEGLAALTRSPRPTRLQTLELDRVRCGDEGLRVLLASATFPSLVKLSVGRNRLTTRGTEAVLERFKRAASALGSTFQKS